VPSKPRYVPKGLTWVEQLFDKKILGEWDGVLIRKVSSVERHASEALLTSEAEKRELVVTRIGTHYNIHRPHLRPERIHVLTLP